MASGFFALLDDIALLMDDVATMGKIATKKTAGILGDDLAVNAEKASGFVSSREIPVLLAITKGSLINKLIILPIAFLLSAYLPMAISIILLLGGFYLAYEGAEKVYEVIFPHPEKKEHTEIQPLSKEESETLEKSRVKAAVITDFILSVEIIVIALGTVTKEPILNQIIIVTFIALVATVGVYGIVALIVRMDDLGLKMVEFSKDKKGLKFTIGNLLISALPKVIKTLSIIGTLALFLVSGGIFVHKIDNIHDILSNLPSLLGEFLAGLILGIMTLLVVKAFKALFLKKQKA